MTGLQIKCGDRILNIASNSCSGIMIVKRNEELYFDVDGMDKDNTVLQWVAGANLKTGDEITISIKKIPVITEPEKKYPFEKMDQESVMLSEEQVRLMYQEKLVYFHALENKLREEGLISE